MQQQQTNGSITFKGLVLASNGGELPPGSSPVFHNCDISADGDVIRRPGSNFVTNIDSTAGSAWSFVMKTRRGQDYLVTVTQNNIKIILCVDNQGTASPAAILTKTNVWTRPLTDVTFVNLTAPYDRLLILTGNHPPVQLSFLERSLDYTCQNAVTQFLTAPSANTDSPLWRDSTVNGTFLIDPLNGNVVILSSKSPGFSVNAPGAGMSLNQVKNFTLVQITWQWWAESLLWYGKDFAQSKTRYNVTAIDQNVKIPEDLVSDLDPRYQQSTFRNVFNSVGNNWITSGAGVPIQSPATVAEWGHGSGERYTFLAGVALNHTPFFATYGATEALGTQSQLTFFRDRELRFNSNTGVAVDNIRVYAGELRAPLQTTLSTSHPPNSWFPFTYTFAGPTRAIAAPVNFTTAIANTIRLSANGTAPTYQEQFIISNSETKWFGANARSELYTDLPVGGGTLDGTFVPAFGLGSFSDYLRGEFPTFGCVFRDRLVLKTPGQSVDQLLLSATSDTLSPSHFYTFFQITDALDGTIDDPFTLNVAAKSREKITALLAWQQSLFVFTAVSTYGVNGGELFGPESFTTSLVSSYGAFNQRCVLATNLTVLFLNRFGLFDLLNKNNTADYGAFERSESVRPIFIDEPIPTRQDSLPWISLNDANNKVYIGLPLQFDTTVCSQLLSLNLSWDSWSTLSSSSNFSCCVGLQILNWTMLVTRNPVTQVVALLQMDATHNLDFVITPNGALPPNSTFTFANPARLVTSKPTGEVVLSVPTAPVIREFGGVTKEGGSYWSTPSSLVGLFPRNIMHDIPELTPIIGTSPEQNFSPFAFIQSNDPFPIYPRLISSTNTTVTFSLPTSASGLPVGNPSTLGAIYTSIFASPSFSASSMGRLKRLKRLHLLFDNTSVNRSRYFGIQTQQMNSALVLTSYNYEESSQAVDAQLVGDYLRLDQQSLDVSPSANSREQLSIPLSGYGCDYQFYVVSTGADAFKLTNYEFDVVAQRSKTYVREA